MNAKEGHPTPRILGCELITDDDRFIKAISNEETTLMSLEAHFPDHMAAIHTSIRRLESERLKAEEIHIYEGRVRAMASKAYGRRDSGWVPLLEGTVDITVNGAVHPLAANMELSHLNISMLGYGDEEGTKYMTCVYHAKGEDGELSGSLYRGGPSVLPREGMHFTIMNTGNA